MHLVSATQFKTLNRGRDCKRAGLGIRKQMISPAEQVGGDVRALRFTISTGSVDREQDAISVRGWDLTNFRRNAVVLWGHDASRLPIGRAFDVKIDGDALKASVEFIPADTPEGGAFAESVYRLARGGFLAATSVGFRPTKWDYTDDEARGASDWFPGIDFEEQELVELSIVTVPANPEALIEAPGPGEGTAIATPNPASGETNLNGAATIIQSALAGTSVIWDGNNFNITSLSSGPSSSAPDPKQEQATARARRRRAFQLALATA
jgi:HK97 family phage prohead protease